MTTKISNLVRRTRFWNNLNQVRSKFAKKINKSKVRTNKAEMKQFASHSEEDITAKR